MVHWRMIIWLFTYAMWSVNAEKNRFHCSFANYSFFELPEKPPHASVKTFLRYMGVFAKLTFPLGVFSIRNFNLRNLKGNGNAPNVCWCRPCCLTSFFKIKPAFGSSTPLSHLSTYTDVPRGGWASVHINLPHLLHQETRDFLAVREECYTLRHSANQNLIIFNLDYL